MSRSVRISSRKSSLAKLQAYLVADALKKKHPGLKIEFQFRDSLGDIDLNSPLWQMQSKGVFTQDFREELLTNKTDLVVHSYKDLDLQADARTKIISVLPRADQRDLLLFRKNSLSAPPGNSIGILSSSPRREYNLSSFLKKALPLRFQNCKINFEPVRGNILTRLSKWKESGLPGIVVAKAAIDRLLSEDFPESVLEEFISLRAKIREVLNESVFMCIPLSENPNAPAQGALAAEIRSSDPELLDLARSISDPGTEESVLHERTVLKKYGGGCHQKIGVAHLKKDYGEIFYVRGITDQNEILSEKFLSIATNAPRPASLNELWPLSKKDLEFNRKAIDPGIYPKSRNLWVSRENAWPDAWRNQDYGSIIWAAGLKTMFELAKKDLWVSGTADGLGETEDAGLSILLPGKPDFLKLTHKDSLNVKSDIERLYTYELELRNPVPEITGKKYFYWMSGYQFDLVFGKNPEIKNAFHASGPGITKSHIEKKLGNGAHVDVFLNFDDWFQYYTGEKLERPDKN
ncbi:MAG: hydroxymethylbilane synthase [Leptospira sp.]|nr:hydroxymethylbilane synthase [Leptospira sp.]